MSENKHVNLSLTAKLLPIIAPFIAKADIRYYLNAINVRPHKGGGAIICATNGHVLGAIYDKDAVCEHEVILRFDGRMQQACAAGLKDGRRVVMIGDRLAVIEDGGAEVCIQAGQPEIEAAYPRYERIIPRPEDLATGVPEMLGHLVMALAQKAAAAAAKVMQKSSYGSVGMTFFTNKGNSSSAAVFRLSCAPEFVGVMMPMRDDYKLPAIPGWAAALTVGDDLASMTKVAGVETPEEVPA